MNFRSQTTGYVIVTHSMAVTHWHPCPRVTLIVNLGISSIVGGFCCSFALAADQDDDVNKHLTALIYATHVGAWTLVLTIGLLLSCTSAIFVSLVGVLIKPR
jgi:hypothetical protein